MRSVKAALSTHWICFVQVPGQIVPFLLALVLYEAFGKSTEFDTVSLQVPPLRAHSSHANL